MSELPEGWTTCNFDDVADATDYVANGSFSSLKENVTQTKKQDYAILVKLKDFSKNWHGDLAYVTKSAYEFLTKSSLKEGDLFIANVGRPGIAFLMPDLGQPMTLGPNGLRVRATDITTNKFLLYYYLSPQGKNVINGLVSGTAQQKFNKTELRSSKVLLPPFNEQKRIAEELDQILEEANNAKSRLDKIPTILKNFRQSIYNAAVTGALSRSWRNKTKFSSAGDLIEMVLNARKREKSFGTLFAEKEYALNIQLPESWVLMNLDKLCSKFTYGSSQKSQNKGDIPVLRMGNIQSGALDWTKLVYSTDEKEIAKYKLNYGDILFNRTNSPELVGKAAIYRGERNAIYAGYLIKISPPEYLNSEYLNMCLNSSFAKDYCWQVKTDGVSQSNINAKKLGKMPIPFCSIEEQGVIVQRVLELLQIADQIEEKYKLAMESVDKITQSLLAKAFRGELVPQDPNDEPASILLERIKVKKELQGLLPKQNRRKHPHKTQEIKKMILSVLDTLKKEKRPLTAQTLLEKSGYPIDSDPEKIEEFFLDIKKSLREGTIVCERVKDEDIFKLAA